LNLLRENNPKCVKNLSHKNHLPINGACVDANLKESEKVQGFGLVHSFLRKMKSGHLF
jgi:hypothetical protein